MWIDVVTAVMFVMIVAGIFIVRAVVVGWRGALYTQVAASAGHGGASTVFGGLTEPLADQLPNLGSSDALQQELRRAGYYKPTARREFLALRNVLALTAALFTGILAVVIGPDRPGLTAPILIWGMAIAVLLYVLPWLYLKLQASQRLQMVQRALPDAFDMLTMCLSGGLTIGESLAHVSRELYGSHPDLSVELEIVRRHSEMYTLSEAFRHLHRRIDLPEVASLCAMIEQSERLGSNLVEAIRDYADGIRTRLRQSADERAGKVGIKLLFPLVLCLAPSALIVLWGPAVLELRDFFSTFSATN